MLNRRVIVPCLLTLAAMPVSFSAMADIGDVGSPVVASNPEAVIHTDQAAAEPSEKYPNAIRVPPAAKEEERRPALVIRFNQRHVYYDRALRQLVEATTLAKPGASYEVVSVVPPLRSGAQPGASDRNSDAASANFNAIIQGLVNEGVSNANIQSHSETSAAVTSQEIQIYVK